MSAAVTNTFRLPSDKWAQLKVQAEKSGLNLTGDLGEVDYHGIKFKYTYDKGQLTIVTVSKPFFVSQAQIDNHLNSLYQQAYNPQAGA